MSTARLTTKPPDSKTRLSDLQSGEYAIVTDPDSRHRGEIVRARMLGSGMIALMLSTDDYWDNVSQSTLEVRILKPGEKIEVTV